MASRVVLPVPQSELSTELQQSDNTTVKYPYRKFISALSPSLSLHSSGLPLKQLDLHSIHFQTTFVFDSKIHCDMFISFKKNKAENYYWILLQNTPHAPPYTGDHFPYNVHQQIQTRNWIVKYSLHLIRQSVIHSG